jgi:hypothetical protein
MAKRRHKSEDTINDIKGGLAVFLTSVFSIYFAIAIIDAIPNINFPISTGSRWFVGVVVGLFVVYVKYVKQKATSYYKR